MLGKLFWSIMPLSNDELENVPEGHRIRPYLLFARKDEESFYAFAATSQMPSDFSFENDYIISGKSQIKLDRCFIININDLYDYNDIDEDGNLVELDSLSKRSYSELIKKLKLSLDFDNNIYPSKVSSKIKNEYSNLSFTNKDILYNGEKYIVCTEENENGYKVYDLSFHAISGYVPFIVNGNNCYINPNFYYLSNINDEYALAFVSNRLPNILNSSMDNGVSYDDDISSIDNLPIGSLIGVFIEDEEYIFIKISEEADYINFIIGRKGAYKRDYVPFSIKKGEEFPFIFYNIMTCEKLDFSLKKINNNCM